MYIIFEEEVSSQNLELRPWIKTGDEWKEWMMLACFPTEYKMNLCSRITFFFCVKGSGERDRYFLHFLSRCIKYLYFIWRLARIIAGFSFGIGGLWVFICGVFRAHELKIWIKLVISIQIELHIFCYSLIL